MDMKLFAGWIVVLLLSGACATDTTAADGGSTRVRPGPDDLNMTTTAETDLSLEPSQPVDYLFRWENAAGEPVRLDVIMLRDPGPGFHCGDWPAEILVGAPLGEPTEASATNIYVGDGGLWADPSVAPGFSESVEIPDEAVDTGYRRDGMALWVDPADDSAIFVVTGSGTQRWPRSAGRSCV